MRRLVALLPPVVRFEHVDRRVLFWLPYAALNLGLGLYFVRFAESGDWSLWAAIPEALARGDLYHPDHNLPFVWSPIGAWLLVPIVALGYWAWVGLHVVVVALLRDGRLIALTLLSWPFWQDTAEGNVMTFVVVTGVLAMRGNRSAGIVYLALFLIAPRPVQGPLAAWLMWRDSRLRWPLVVLVVLSAGLVVWSGYLVDWVAAITGYGAGDAITVHTIGPPRWFGLWWLVAGIPLGAWFFIRGRIGLSGLSISPYWLPIYLLTLLWEASPMATSARANTVSASNNPPTAHEAQKRGDAFL